LPACFATGATTLALAKLCGRLTLRLADAEILPFDFCGAAQTHARYATELVKLADEMRRETGQANSLITEGFLKLAADPDLPFVLPKPKPAVPFLNFAPLQNACDELKAAAEAYQLALQRSLDNGKRLAAPELRALNRVLYQSERALLDDSGLPRRPWFRHLIYAPGFYTGYGVKTLPGAREGIEERKWDEANQEILTAAAALRRYTGEILKAEERLR
jgi:N-acetylated-alpha-linked acidic dipeptidase